MRRQRKKIQNGQKGISGLKARAGRDRSISRGGLECAVGVYMSEESEQ